MPRPPAEEIEYPATLLVAAERLDHRAQRRVEHQVEGEQLAVEPLAAAPVRQKDEDQRATERFVELSRMDGDGARRAGRDQLPRCLRLVRERIGRKARREQVVGVTSIAPAAACGDAADPPKRLPDGHGRAHRVGIGQELHVVAAHVPDREQDRADEAAVEHQAALPELEDTGEIVRVLVPVDDDEEDPGADHRRDQDAEGEIEHLVAVEPRSLRGTCRQRHGHKEAGGDEDSVGVHRDRQRPLEVKEVLPAEHPHRQVQHCRGAGSPDAERLPRLLLAGGARRADLPGAGSGGEGEPDHDAQRGRNRQGEQDWKHQAFLAAGSAGALAGFFANSISRNNIARPTVIPLSATLKVGQWRAGRSQPGSNQCQSMKSIT